jgi:hypothetical protein
VGPAPGATSAMAEPLDSSDPENSGADDIPPASCRTPAAGCFTPSNDGKRMAGDILSPAVGSPKGPGAITSEEWTPSSQILHRKTRSVTPQNKNCQL